MVEVEVSPLRGINDFLLESARFQVPNYKDLDKWANRVINNLLYYQTNYFVTYVAVFVLVGLIYPGKVLMGMSAIILAFGLFYYLTNKKTSISKFKKDHPIVTLVAIFTGGYFIVYVLGSVLVFLFGIILPLVVVLTHASLRLRNIKNKITNKIESVGLKKTPMSILLETLGLDPGVGL